MVLVRLRAPGKVHASVPAVHGMVKRRERLALCAEPLRMEGSHDPGKLSVSIFPSAWHVKELWASRDMRRSIPLGGNQGMLTSFQIMSAGSPVMCMRRCTQLPNGLVKLNALNTKNPSVLAGRGTCCEEPVGGAHCAPEQACPGGCPRSSMSWGLGVLVCS